MPIIAVGIRMPGGLRFCRLTISSNRRTYDFFYLPIDFKNKCNMGYAFINMVSPQYILPLVERFNNRKWDKFNSEKVASITYARIQVRYPDPRLHLPSLWLILACSIPLG